MSELLLSDYFTGSGGAADDSTNCRAALQAAIDAAYTAGGADIVAPGGICRIAGSTDVSKSFATKEGMYRIRGVGGSALRMMSAAYNRIALNTAHCIAFENLTMLGDLSDVISEATNAHLHLSGNLLAEIRGCDFFGLMNPGSGGLGVIYANATHLNVEECGFYGCAGVACIAANNANAVTVRNCQFRDYGWHDNVYYSKTPAGINAWISVINSGGSQTDATKQCRLTVEGCTFDEGAGGAPIGTSGTLYVVVKDSAFNLPGDGNGPQFTNAHGVELERTWIGYSGNPNGNAVRLDTVNQFTMRDCRIDAGADFIDLGNSTKRAIFSNVRKDGNPLTAADLINTAGCLIEIDGVQVRAGVRQIG
jgi:hypothetical protein